MRTNIVESDILKQLSRIIDPDFDKDIVSLGFIKNLKIKKGRVSFEIELTTAACPVKNEFRKQAEQLVSEIDGVTAVDVKMTSRKQNLQIHRSNFLSKVKNIIAVASCKGGVGKSSVAAHLACELAGRGQKTGLLDADLFGPSVPTLFNLHNPGLVVTEQNIIKPVDTGLLKLVSFGFIFGESPAVMRGPMVSGYIQQILHSVDWGDLDYLIIDMPPGTGDVQLTITQSIQLDGAVIVTTPQALSVVDVIKGIKMFEKVNVPMLGLVENMAYFLCDTCDTKHFLFGGSEDSDLTEEVGLPTIIKLPLVPNFSRDIIKADSNPLVAAMTDNVIRMLGKHSLENEFTPTYRFDKKYLYIEWPGGEKSQVAHYDLRGSCRCALCMDEYSGERLIREGDIPPDIKPTEIRTLGNYALDIDWSDGHNTGIYPYKRIKDMMVKCES